MLLGCGPFRVHPRFRGSDNITFPLHSIWEGVRMALVNLSFLHFHVLFLPGRPNSSGTKQRKTLLGGLRRLLRPAIGLLSTTGIFCSEKIVWFGAYFHFTTKMSDFFPLLSLNKGGPFGFHNSDHMTPSWNFCLGSQAQRLPRLLLGKAVFGSGAMPASLAPLPEPVVL